MISACEGTVETVRPPTARYRQRIVKRQQQRRQKIAAHLNVHTAAAAAVERARVGRLTASVLIPADVGDHAGTVERTIERPGDC